MVSEWQVRWSAAALTALDAVVEPGLRQRIPDRVDTLCSYPLAGESARSRHFGSVRQAVVAPFILFYLPLEETQTVHVLALSHGRRDRRAER